jgi:mannitol-1-/sugar-/sorbitol-6-phosphatase
MRSASFPRRFDALLFDMDGTILSSIASAERVWAAWARRHGLDVEAFLPTIHGVQSVETIRRLDLAGVDAAEEAAAITEAEIADVVGIEPIAGAAAFLKRLPPKRWAVVTSAPRRLATARLRAAKLPSPALMITAEDASRGKPAPDCYQLAAERLSVEPARCLVFEDAPAGIAAGEAAGAALMVVSTLHRQPLDTKHPKIDSFEELDVEVSSDGSLVVTHVGSARPSSTRLLP